MEGFMTYNLHKQTYYNLFNQKYPIVFVGILSVPFLMNSFIKNKRRVFSESGKNKTLTF